MNVKIKLIENMKIVGINKMGLETFFDTHPEVGGENTAPTPVEVTLQALGACTMMDVVSILRKKRKTIDSLTIDIEANRRKEHPRIITDANLIFHLISPDAELADLERSIELSQEKYCSVSAMFKLAGCKISWKSYLDREN